MEHSAWHIPSQYCFPKPNLFNKRIGFFFLKQNSIDTTSKFSIPTYSLGDISHNVLCAEPFYYSFFSFLSNFTLTRKIQNKNNFNMYRSSIYINLPSRYGSQHVLWKIPVKKYCNANLNFQRNFTFRNLHMEKAKVDYMNGMKCKVSNYRKFLQIQKEPKLLVPKRVSGQRMFRHMDFSMLRPLHDGNQSFD